MPRKSPGTAAPAPACSHHSGQQPQKYSKRVTGRTQMLQAAAAAAPWHEAIGLVSWREERQSCSLQLGMGASAPLLHNLPAAFPPVVFFFSVKLALFPLPQRVLCSKTPARVGTGNVSLTSSAGKLGLLCPQSIVPAPLLPVCHPSSGTTSQLIPEPPQQPSHLRGVQAQHQHRLSPHLKVQPGPLLPTHSCCHIHSFFPGNDDSR